MASSDTIRIPTPKLKLTVHLPRGFTARLWLTCKIIKIAGWVSGWNIEVVTEAMPRDEIIE